MYNLQDLYNYDYHFFLLFKAVSIDAPSHLTVGLDGTDIKTTCILNISIELSSVQLAWFLDGIVNSTEFVGGGALYMEDTASLSLDLNVDSVNAFDAGLYTCRAMVTDALGDMANITRDYELFVQCESTVQLSTVLLLIIKYKIVNMTRFKLLYWNLCAFSFFLLYILSFLKIYVRLGIVKC